MKSTGSGITFWPYEVCNAAGVVSSGIIFAPSAASAAWHVMRFIAPDAQVRCPRRALVGSLSTAGGANATGGAASTTKGAR